MRRLTLDSILSGTLGKLTPDPAERRNVLWQTAATMCGFAALTLSATTILSGYLKKSGFSYTEIGIISTAVLVVNTLSQLGLMGFADRTQKRISVSVLCLYLGAGGIFMLAATSAVPRSLMPPLVLLVALVVVQSLSQVPGVLAGMLNFSVLVRTIHVDIRGRVWGIVYVAVGVLTILLSLLAGILLKRLGYPQGYALCFLLAAGFAALRGVIFGRQTELPDISLPGTSRSVSPFVALVDMCKLKEFRMLAYPHVLRGILVGIMSFVVPTQIERLSLSNQYVGYMAAVVSAAGLVGAILLGLTHDRWGAGVVTLLGDILTALAWVALMVVPSPITFLALFLVFNIGDVLEQRAIPLGSLEIVPTGLIGGFSGARLMILSGSSALGSLVGGILLDTHGAFFIFVVAAVLKLIMGIWFLKVFGLRRRISSKPS